MHPNSLKNLKPGQSPGRKQDYDQPKGQRVELRVTQTAKDILKSENNPFKAAGYASLSAYVDAVCRGEVELKPANSNP